MSGQHLSSSRHLLIFLNQRQPNFGTRFLNGLYFAIFGRSSGSACFYSRILSIYQETRIAISFLMCRYLLIFPGTRWPLYPGCHYSLLIIHFLDVVTQLNHRPCTAISVYAFDFEQHKTYYGLGILGF